LKYLTGAARGPLRCALKLKGDLINKPSEPSGKFGKPPMPAVEVIPSSSKFNEPGRSRYAKSLIG
jgi:hypothetical protein